MESLKEKLPMIIAVVVAIAICVATLYFFENYESVYYTQIDNTKIEKLSSYFPVSSIKVVLFSPNLELH